MQKIFLFLAMLFFSHCTFAGWVHLMHADNYIYYGDPESIEISGGYKVRMLVLEDFALYKMSRVNLHEFDCKTKNSRVLAEAEFSENMGRGEIKLANKVNWDLGIQSSNTLGRIELEFACRRAKFNF